MALNENPTLQEIVDEVERLNNLIVDRGGSQTITPSTSNKTLNKGYYKGNITIKGDANLVASNIVSGKSIFGVNGNVTVSSLGGVKLVAGYKYTEDYVEYSNRISKPETTLFTYTITNDLSKFKTIRFNMKVKQSSTSAGTTYAKIFINDELKQQINTLGTTANTTYSYDFAFKTGDVITVKAYSQYAYVDVSGYGLSFDVE